MAIDLNEKSLKAMAQEIDYLAALSHIISRDHGWWESDFNFGEKIALIHSELSEALEHFRKGEAGFPDTHCPDFGKLAIELADVVIRVCDLAGHLRISLGDAIVAKCRANNQRPYRHGGRAF